MAGEGPIKDLRNVGNVASKAKNPWDTDVITPGAERRTKAENETNSGSQYETGSGKTAGPLGGMNAGK